MVRLNKEKEFRTRADEKKNRIKIKIKNAGNPSCFFL